MRAPDLHCTMRCTCFIDLPAELIAVCRRLRDIIDNSLELQYRIELVQDGMIDGSAMSSTSALARLTTVERLDRLRQLRHAWETLSWTRCVTMPVPGPCCAYELVGGIFCKTQPGPAPRGTGLGVAGGFNPALFLGLQLGLGVGIGEWNAVPSTRSVKMSTTWLPGREANNQGKTVVRDDLGIPTRDFAMDPSQDLMILFTGDDVPMPTMAGTLELHIRTMSTNRVHPEAKKPILRAWVVLPITSVFLQIVDDVVGVMYCIDPSRPRIIIWNWKTGNLVADRSNGHLPPNTSDFSFINSRAIFVTTTGHGGGSLELFTFTCDPTCDPANADPQPHDSLVSTLMHVATLYLPQILPLVGLLSIGTHTGPFLARCPPDKLFVSSNEDRIHVLTIQYAHVPTPDVPHTRPRVCVFTHNRMLEGYVHEGLERGTVIEVPWSEWGQTHTRMLPYTGIFQWLRYVHGQRVVLLLPTEVGNRTLQVLDFNVRNFARHDHHDCESACDVDSDLPQTTRDVVDHPSRVTMPSVFVDVVESGLPYYEVRRDVQGDYSGMMIDDERLVGLKYPAFLTGDMKEIDVFTM